MTVTGLAMNEMKTRDCKYLFRTVVSRGVARGCSENKGEDVPGPRRRASRGRLLPAGLIFIGRRPVILLVAAIIPPVFHGVRARLGIPCQRVIARPGRGDCVSGPCLRVPGRR